MSELMKKESKEEYGSSVREKLFVIGNIFITKQVLLHTAIKRILCLVKNCIKYCV